MDCFDAEWPTRFFSGEWCGQPCCWKSVFGAESWPRFPPIRHGFDETKSFAFRSRTPTLLEPKVKVVTLTFSCDPFLPVFWRLENNLNPESCCGSKRVPSGPPDTLCRAPFRSRTCGLSPGKMSEKKGKKPRFFWFPNGFFFALMYFDVESRHHLLPPSTKHTLESLCAITFFNFSHGIPIKLAGMRLKKVSKWPKYNDAFLFTEFVMANTVRLILLSKTSRSWENRSFELIKRFKSWRNKPWWWQF